MADSDTGRPVELFFTTVSGWFILKGRHGVIGRGKWLIAAGMLPPIVAIIIFQFGPR